MTGWNLPPGCSSADVERALGVEGPCEVCGQSVEDCVCPECPVCGAVGDPACYADDDLYRGPWTTGRHHAPTHGLIRSLAQVALAAEADRIADEEARAEDEYYSRLEREDAALRGLV